MPPRTPESYLFDMLEAARKIQRFTAGYDQERFKQDEKTVSAVERQLMIIGEAAKQIDPSFRSSIPRDRLSTRSRDAQFHRASL